MARASSLPFALAVPIAFASAACSFAVDDYRVAGGATDARVDESGATDAEDATSTHDGVTDVPATDADDGADAEGDVLCDPSLFACSGSCVDLASDSKNCGTCGHSCPSGQCKKGNCK